MIGEAVPFSTLPDMNCRLVRDLDLDPADLGTGRIDRNGGAEWRRQGNDHRQIRYRAKNREMRRTEVPSPKLSTAAGPRRCGSIRTHVRAGSADRDRCRLLALGNLPGSAHDRQEIEEPLGDDGGSGDAVRGQPGRCMAALRDRLTRPWRSISMTTTMTSSPTDTTSSTVGTW